MEVSFIATIGILPLIGIDKKNTVMMIDFALAAARDQGLGTSAALRRWWSFTMHFPRMPDVRSHQTA